MISASLLRALLASIAGVAMASSCAAVSLAGQAPGTKAVIAKTPGQAPLPFTLDGIAISYGVMSAFVLPGGNLKISTPSAKTASVLAERGELLLTAPMTWRWTAPPEPGNYEIHIRDRSNARATVLTAFVLQPYDGAPLLNGYPLGDYVKDAKNGDPAFRVPPGFVLVTKANVETAVSPHFRLRQFLCRDSSVLPKYLALSTKLLVKLEMLVDALAARDLPAETLHVLSAFRTPANNAAIGNETSLSRHLYGDAADVFLDRDGDQMQDDLDGDGQTTMEDIKVLYDLADKIDESLPVGMKGGVADYEANQSHGPFLHVDARGQSVRW